MSERIVAVTSATALTDPRVLKEADALAAAGYEVTVLAWDRASEAERTLAMPGGWTLENVGPLAAHGAGLRNVGRYLAFWREATSRAFDLAPDAVHCHNLDSAPVALRIRRRRRRGVRLVFDFHEIYRESRALPQRGVAGAVARAAARVLERRSLAAADQVITVVEAQVGYYEALGARGVAVIENAPDLERYAPVVRDAHDFVVSFIGQKRLLTALENLMTAVQGLPRVRALLVGGGPGQDAVAAFAEGLERVEVAGRIDPSDVPALYRRCDAVYACYDATLLNWRTALPVKVMEGMACALPVIVTKGTYIAEYVERNGLGLAVDYSDVGELTRALARLEGDRAAAREMGRRGREIVERELNWGAVARRLVGSYDALFGHSADDIE